MRVGGELKADPRPCRHSSLRLVARPLTSHDRNCVLRGLIDGLSQESEEGMWYGTAVVSPSDKTTLPPQL